MREIVVEMKDGTVHRFEPKGRSGGSYGISVRYEGSWVIVRDEWDNEQAFPMTDVKQVKTQADRRSW